MPQQTELTLFISDEDTIELSPISEASPCDFVYALDTLHQVRNFGEDGDPAAEEGGVTVVTLATGAENVVPGDTQVAILADIEVHANGPDSVEIELDAPKTGLIRFSPGSSSEFVASSLGLLQVEANQMLRRADSFLDVFVSVYSDSFPEAAAQAVAQKAGPEDGYEIVSRG